MVRVALAAVFFALIAGNAPAAENSAKLLLDRLNLNYPGLENVRNAPTPEKAAEALLAYYRQGGSGKHPINRNDRLKSKGSYASERDFRLADDALKHVLFGSGGHPSFFRGETIDWINNPVADNEWIWQLNRMYFWDAMSKVYWHTGDEKYAKEWVAQFMHWTSSTPNDKAHENAWRSLEAGIRGHSWMALFQRFVDSPAFTPEVLVAFLNSCYDHEIFLMKRYSARSNWGLMEAEGMAFIAIMFPQFSDAEIWLKEAFRRFNIEIHLQVYPDGHQLELCMGYHSGCVEWFMRTFELAKLNGMEKEFTPDYLKVIEKMCEVPMKLCFPDGTHAQFGDDGRGIPGRNRADYVRWAKIFDRPDFLFVATDGAEGRQPAQTASELPQSGLYSWRSSWDRNAIFMALKCGPDGGWHCQPDNGTFVLYAGGRILMPDAGNYIYHGDEFNRAWFRQTRVHKTLTLDNRDSKYAPRQLLWKTGDNLDVLVVENDSYENLTHRRAVFFVDKKYFVVVDEAIGSASGQLDLHFQLAPSDEGNPVIADKGHSISTNFSAGWNVALQAWPQSGMTCVEEEGYVSPEYMQKIACPAFSWQIRKQSSKGVRFVTIIAPYEGTSSPAIKIASAGKSAPGSKSFTLKLTDGGLARELSYSIP